MKLNFAFWHHYLMRLKPYNSAILLTVFFALVSAISVYAQEEKGGDQDPIVKESLRNDPDPVLSDSEIRGGKPLTLPAASKETVKDSTAQVNHPKIIRPIKAIEKAPKEEDPLSFNFLYYIIEKFKLSDIIE